jgi:hypothetical protein
VGHFPTVCYLSQLLSHVAGFGSHGYYFCNRCRTVNPFDQHFQAPNVRHFSTVVLGHREVAPFEPNSYPDVPHNVWYRASCDNYLQVKDHSCPLGSAFFSPRLLQATLKSPAEGALSLLLRQSSPMLNRVPIVLF